VSLGAIGAHDSCPFHLILAGHPTITGRVRSKLPKHLAEKLVDMVPAPHEAPDTDIVKATLASFIDQEEDESQAAAEEIERQMRTGGLAVTGAEASLQALRRQQADMLVIARNFRSHPGWSCTRCGFMGGQSERPNTCPECDGAELQDLNVKETMVKLAEQQGCTVEVVSQSEPLARLGGVEVLVRYRLPDEYL
jgi:peptide subunit release factor 1 (eRF1)